ncbi:hypothetical protein MRX96_024514 [Rhipicephalus microplus]
MRRGHKLVLRCVANQQRKMAEIKARQDDYELMVQAMLRKCDAVLKGLESRRSKSSAVPAYTCIKTTPPGRGTSQDASIDFQKAASSSFGVQGGGRSDAGACMLWNPTGKHPSDPEYLGVFAMRRRNRSDAGACML